MRVKMELNINVFLLIAFICSASAYVEIHVPESKSGFDLQFLYEGVMDPELCEKQLAYLDNNTYLLARFLEAGIRVPTGLLEGNIYDFGNYYQCLNINEVLPDSTIQGKYCVVNFPTSQNINIPEFTLPEWPDIPWLKLFLKNEVYSDKVLKPLSKIRQFRKNKFSEGIAAESTSLSLAVCMPKACSTKHFLEGLTINVTQFGFRYEEEFCRLPNDKQWVPADYAALVVFSLLLIIVVISTGYDIFYTVIIGTKNELASCIYRSLYTNTRRLVTYNAVPGAIECLDGIRAFATMWVIIGHTYVNQIQFPLANPLVILDWLTSINSIWVTLGPITVDTFFLISGLLLVYTTAGKLTRRRLLKNLHIFYLNRLLRMFPVLAAYVLLMASLLNRISDGPHWSVVSVMTEHCRTYWWTTLLNIQNWYNPDGICLYHSWYLAIDVQLYILSPIVLFWVLGKNKLSAWIALCSSLLLVLVGSSIYNFIQEFQAWPVVPSRSMDDQHRYIRYYYMNTLTRASPFFVGMIYGYLLHLYRGQKIVFSKVSTAILWLSAMILFFIITFSTYQFMMIDWDNQLVDNLVNSFMRPVWALAVGWIVFACEKGYGGPINWVLSLRAWKILGRLSYAMYIVHYPLINIVNSSVLAPNYFSGSASFFKFLADFTLAAIVAFLMTLFVDAPCSILIKMAMGGEQRRSQPRVEPVKIEDIKGGAKNSAFRL